MSLLVWIQKAMLKSVFSEIVGLVELSLKNIEEKTKQKPRLIFTGGDADIFARYFKADYSDGLVCEGIRLMILEGLMFGVHNFSKDLNLFCPENVYSLLKKVLFMAYFRLTLDSLRKINESYCTYSSRN